MKDAALRALYAAIDDARPGLLLADEQCIETPARHDALQVITNRVDVRQRFADAGFSCALSDFAVAAAPARIYYRLSKEKALVHYLINQSLAGLPLGGQLLLAGDKSDGFKTYYQKACALVASARSARKVAGGAYLGVIEKRVEPSAALDDSDYTALVDIAPAHHPRLLSKPGIYGWKKIDRGSALLVECLQALLEGQSEAPSSVLDLGCGYGYLSVMASRYLPGGRIVATDNNVTALAACEANFAEHGIRGECVAADCAGGIDERFDLVVCNPPFHKGFELHGDLTKAFLSAAAARLKAGGSALFVVNQFIGLEQKAVSLFARCRLLAARDGFTVFLLSA